MAAEAAVNLGLGVSNRPGQAVAGGGCRVTARRTDREHLDREVLELEEQGLELRLGPGYLDRLEADVVFRTPGMHPANPALEALRSQGAVVTSEMEVFFQVCPCPVIAVTGSDGKTTTTTLIAEMLQGSREDRLGGRQHRKASAPGSRAHGSFGLGRGGAQLLPADGYGPQRPTLPW